MDISSRSIIKVLSLTLLFLMALGLIYMARRQLIWVGTAFFFAVALNPFVESISRYMPRKNRGAAIASVFILALLLLAFLLISFVPPLVEQSQSLVNNLPHYSDQLAHGQGFVPDLVRQYNLSDRIRESQSQIVGYASTAGSQFFTIVKGLFSGFIAGITILVLTFFMLLEGPRWLDAFWYMVPAKRREHGRLLAAQMYRAVTGYVHGNLFTSLIAVIAVSIMLMLVRVPYAIPLGILVGIFDLLPLVGATIAAVIVTLVALFTSATAAIIMAIFFMIYQQVENHVIQPIVYGRTVEISPLVVLVAVLTGAAVGGIIGAIVAIPIFASLQIVFKDYAQRHLMITEKAD